MNKEWERQLAFNKKFYQWRLGKDLSKLTVEERISETKEFIVHLLREVGEILNAIPGWKMHRGDVGDFTNGYQKYVVEELIDAQKFLWGLFQIWGIDFETFQKEFHRKSDTVDQRFFQEHELPDKFKDEKVVAIDIDGVLCDYTESITSFIKIETDIKYKTAREAKRQLNAVRWEELKHKFRSSGFKTTANRIPGSREFLETLKKADYYIVLISARPYGKYTRIFNDTVEWLKINKMPYDALFFDELKHVKIVKHIPHMQFMVEDRYRYAFDIAKMGYKVYVLKNKEYLLPEDCPDNFVIVESLSAILNFEGMIT